MENKELSIIHVVPSTSEEARGPSYSVTRLCQELVAQYQKVTLAVLDDGSISDNLPFVKPHPLGFGPKRIGISPQMKTWLSNQAANGNVQIIHNHSLWMMPNIYPGKVSKKYRIPLVLSPRGTLSKRAFKSGSPLKKIVWPLLQRHVLETATCFHATGESEYRDIRRMGFQQPVAVIPNGIDIFDLPPRIQSSFQTLLFLGRIHSIKGLDMLLPSWKTIQSRFPNWMLRIVGPDNNGYLFEMKRLADSLGLERIEFSGPLHGERKWAAYRDADLFVLPTYSENFGMTVAESLSTGTPAIVTKGAPWEGLELHKAGWWVDISTAALVACLETALSLYPEQLKEMGLRGKKWMAQDFSWDAVTEKMVGVYRWIVDGGKPPECVKVD